ncbi:hypothetical protein [Halosimplex halophilum]|uniref:hypothetical protein n=1 Tax=Halosimplex halophilum TaxID=2559572 RepID=UPI00107F09D3|nr:hypothetical protein [Halosimplex halophilum]
MDDSAALRLTLRRCTAVVVVGLGLIAANTHRYGPNAGFGHPLAYLAVGYLAVSLLAGFFPQSGDSFDSAGGPPPGDEDGPGDEGGPDADADDGDADTDHRDRPPAATGGGERR